MAVSAVKAEISKIVANVPQGYAEVRNFSISNESTEGTVQAGLVVDLV